MLTAYRRCLSMAVTPKLVVPRIMSHHNHVRSLVSINSSLTSQSLYSLVPSGRPFFNRKDEIDSCNLLLLNDPAINVFTGPPNSGKTRLLKEVLSRLPPDCPILHFDLRSHSWNDAESFLISMEQNLKPWSEKIVEAIKHVKLGYSGVSLSYDGPEKPLMSRVGGFLTKIADNMPQRNFWTGEKFPIIFIDEANKMTKLTHTKEGKDVLMMLLEFFVQCTKQDSRFPVILASSDSFYHLWLRSMIGGRFRTRVIDNLSKEEARRYWEQHAVPDKLEKSGYKPPEFEDVFAVCGGNMYLIDEYCVQYLEQKGKLKSPEEFWFVREARLTLGRSLLESPAAWSKDQLLEVMKRMTENRFIDYNELCKEMTQAVVDAMIEANLVHFMPHFKVGDHNEEISILVPESAPDAVAMRMITEKHNYI